MNASSSPPHAPPGPATVAATLPDESWRTWSGLWRRRTNLIAGGSLLAILGSISLCARRAIIVKSPVVLEQIAGCRTAIFDKTGTLTYGEPKLTERVISPGFVDREVLSLVAGLERYSKHPLARAILAAAREESLVVPEATEVSEAPGQGLKGTVSGHQVRITSRNQIVTEKMAGGGGDGQLPEQGGRVHAHQPANAYHRPSECRGWDGPEHRRHGVRGDGTPDPGERGHRPGNHRCAGGSERPAGRLFPQGDSRSLNEKTPFSNAGLRVAGSPITSHENASSRSTCQRPTADRLHRAYPRRVDHPLRSGDSNRLRTQ